MKSHGCNTLKLVVKYISFLCILEHVIAARVELGRVENLDNFVVNLDEQYRLSKKLYRSNLAICRVIEAIDLNWLVCLIDV